MLGSHEKKSDYLRQLINSSCLIWIQVGALAKPFKSLWRTFVELQITARHDMQMWRLANSSPGKWFRAGLISLRFVRRNDFKCAGVSELGRLSLHVTCTWWDNTVKLRYFRTKQISSDEGETRTPDEHEEAFKSFVFSWKSGVFPALTFNGTMKSTQTRTILIEIKF